MRVLLILFLIMAGGASGQPLVPGSVADYGSGAAVETELYCPGGLPQIGLFVGNPNNVSRNDRALVKFKIAPYLLRPVETISIRSATLVFQVTGLYGKSATRKIEVSHLLDDVQSFSGNDLVNARVKKVATLMISRDSVAPRLLTVEVGQFVSEDIRSGNKSSAFRFRDVEAEAKGNVDVQPTGVIVGYTPNKYPCLEIKENP